MIELFKKLIERYPHVAIGVHKEDISGKDFNELSQIDGFETEDGEYLMYENPSKSKLIMSAADAEKLLIECIKKDKCEEKFCPVRKPLNYGFGICRIHGEECELDIRKDIKLKDCPVIQELKNELL
jgi:hypothetical protein